MKVIFDFSDIPYEVPLEELLNQDCLFPHCPALDNIPNILESIFIKTSTDLEELEGFRLVSKKWKDFLNNQILKSTKYKELFKTVKTTRSWLSGNHVQKSVKWPNLVDWTGHMLDFSSFQSCHESGLFVLSKFDSKEHALFDVNGYRFIGTFETIDKSPKMEKIFALGDGHFIVITKNNHLRELPDHMLPWHCIYLTKKPDKKQLELNMDLSFHTGNWKSSFLQSFQSKQSNEVMLLFYDYEELALVCHRIKKGNREISVHRGAELSNANSCRSGNLVCLFESRTQ